MIIDSLPEIRLTKNCNYIAAFLTMDCNLQCSYCINLFNGNRTERRIMSGNEWIEALNRINAPSDLPITLQGGEPLLHPDFYKIINGIRDGLKIDILTNLQSDINEFIANVPVSRVKRNAPYASIRVTYQPGQMQLTQLIRNVLRLLENGYSIGVWAIRHPSQIDEIELAKKRCLEAGIDFRFKEFIGYHKGKLYGKYKYPEAVCLKPGTGALCKTTELIIGPTGKVYRCHSDLYSDRKAIGHISDPTFRYKEVYRSCNNFGLCNPCDIKIKTNRFQQSGHTSVDILK